MPFRDFQRLWKRRLENKKMSEGTNLALQSGSLMNSYPKSENYPYETIGMRRNVEMAQKDSPSKLFWVCFYKCLS